jgi:hypothetical protein
VTPPARRRRPSDPDQDPDDWWRRSDTLRRIPWLIGLVVVAVVIATLTRGQSSVRITKSCTSAAFALATYSPSTHAPLRWAVTGPPGTRVLLTIGVSGFADSGGRLQAEPEAGRTLAQTQASGEPLVLPGSCLVQHTMGLVVPPGRYAATLFRFTGSGSTEQATAVQTRVVRVTRG